jgi:hypothetical protein
MVWRQIILKRHSNVTCGHSNVTCCHPMSSKCDVRCDVDVVVYIEALSSAPAHVSSRWVYLEVDHSSTFVFSWEFFSATRTFKKLVLHYLKPGLRHPK